MAHATTWSHVKWWHCPDWAMEPLEAQPPRWSKRWYYRQLMLPSNGTALSGDGTILSSGGTTLLVIVPPNWVVILSSVSLQAVVLPSTSETRDETLFSSIFEVIGAYEYPTLSCMKEHKIVNEILEIFYFKSVEKVLSVILLLL